ncbi:hypothetical protein [Bacillus sp. AFS017336]|uniref:hypothetical protein n=1 Tax=Bacillus sp. AFS017336 TaxID=2033489 RepID=UPI000BF0318E|nr:hypothetical protein [Bacillus sp. AFS017336]PEL14235.1 hypothetical protein CN601_01435 [Bacillus sp. AFS017336]
MKIKILVLFMTILFTLTACNNQKKYDAQINQVIKLENIYQHNEMKLKDTKKIKRSEIAIVFYKNGKYINLIYDLNKSNQIDCFYKKTNGSNYIRYLNTDKEIEKAEKDLRKDDYLENTGRK